MLLRPSEGEGFSSIPAPNTLRHFSPPTKGGMTPHPTAARARLPNTVIAKHFTAAGAQAGEAVPAMRVQWN
jgi:hypothetical protein